MATWMTFDPGVLFVGACVFGVALVTIWAPRRLARRNVRRALLTVGSIAALLAILPAVLPYDHLLPAPGVAAHHKAQETHEEHCHSGLGSCADAPLSSGAGQFLSSAPLLLDPALVLLLLVVSLPLLVGMTVRPTLRPPMQALSS